jgi:nucleotide-binding universal stress UspA family protein
VKRDYPDRDAQSSRADRAGVHDGSGQLKVLVAVDGSEHATRAAQRAADFLRGRSVESRLLVVLSFELDPYTLLGEPLADAPEREAMVQQAVERAVTEPRRILEEAGHLVSVGHRFGGPAEEILGEIERLAPDLVVLGRRGLSGPARWLLGSVSDRVVRHARAPVLVVS